MSFISLSLHLNATIPKTVILEICGIDIVSKPYIIYD